MIKIKEEHPRPLQYYTNCIEGRVQFWFTKKEIPLLFREIDKYVDILKKRYNEHELTYYFSWHYSSADLFWNRKLTGEEKAKVKKIRAEARKETKLQELKYAKKLAKKYKLI